MINIVEYVQALDNILKPPRPIGTGTGPGINIPLRTSQPSSLPTTKVPPNTLEKNPNGYPILPIPFPSDTWKKTAWDSLFTEYLGQHYNLACGGKDRHIPYKRISENQTKYIDPKYLPRGTDFRPPRNIGINEMKSIFQHLLSRQQKHGPEDTFKFKSIKLKGITVPAIYNSTIIVSPGATHITPCAGGRPGPDTPATNTRSSTRRNTSIPPPSSGDLNPGATNTCADVEPDTTSPETNKRCKESNPCVGATIPTRPRPRPNYKKQSNATNREPETCPQMVTDVVTVDHPTMEKLLRMGVPPHAASNGPNDGLPLYKVDGRKYRHHLESVILNNSPIDPNIDPNL